MGSLKSSVVQRRRVNLRLFESTCVSQMPFRPCSNDETRTPLFLRSPLTENSTLEAFKAGDTTGRLFLE
ncbi:hypothetical protein MIND_01187700 [Mycena indigotica]|uniref:Uncharacterized protein n=1 Tax=Mycena indigotica TaxID=2126181 RepID=A0A8H6S6B8_9AGAR|nr:uncharacterized protein MIND_01187700 [Mycena indigotica]KAF7292886.1 hypothetical protein MIND_01187700 [Mycena indigotica]